MARASEAPGIEAIRVRPAAIGKPAGVSDHTLESAVQIAALLIRQNDADPGGALILQKCGQIHVAEAARAKADVGKLGEWACAEARRRSPGLDHKEIVSQAMPFKAL
jgi:hypothetical protein